MYMLRISCLQHLIRRLVALNFHLVDMSLLTDTVGFIQKLPATLIAAFRATLEEVVEAEIVLLHVLDASHVNVLQHVEAVEDTLGRD